MLPHNSTSARGNMTIEEAKCYRRLNVGSCFFLPFLTKPQYLEILSITEAKLFFGLSYEQRQFLYSFQNFSNLAHVARICPSRLMCLIACVNHGYRITLWWVSKILSEYVVLQQQYRWHLPAGTAKVSLAEGPSLQVLQRHSLMLTAVGGWLTSGAWEAEVKAH